MRTLGEVRSEIDGIDREIVSLILRRTALADEVAAAKRAEGVSVADPARERAVLERIAALAGGENAERIGRIYSILFEMSKGRQLAAR